MRSIPRAIMPACLSTNSPNKAHEHNSPSAPRTARSLFQPRPSCPDAPPTESICNFRFPISDFRYFRYLKSRFMGTLELLSSLKVERWTLNVETFGPSGATLSHRMG